MLSDGELLARSATDRVCRTGSDHSVSGGANGYSPLAPSWRWMASASWRRTVRSQDGLDARGS
jgi:hypothetical protein